MGWFYLKNANLYVGNDSTTDQIFKIVRGETQLTL